MLVIQNLYRISHRESYSYNPALMSVSDFVKDIDFQTRLYIFAVDVVLKKEYPLNFSKLITQYRLKGITWEGIAEELTDEMLIGCSVDYIPGFATGSSIPSGIVTIWDGMNIPGIEFNYADMNTGLEGIYPIRFRLKDLSIKISNSVGLRHDTVIPIVNGVCCRPCYFEDRGCLYAINGSRLVKPHTLAPYTPEINLLDFSQIAKFEILGITTEKTDTHFQLDVGNSTDSPSLSADWIFISPVSLYENTPLFVIDGMIIWPDEYSIVSENKIAIPIQKFPLNVFCSLKAYFSEEGISDSGILCKTEPVIEKLFNSLKESPTDINKSSFVILLKGKDIFLNRTRLQTWESGYTLESRNPDGILIQSNTHRIVSAIRNEFSDRRNLSLAGLGNVFLADRDFENEQIAYVRPIRIDPYMKSIFQSQYETLSVTR